MSDNKQAPKLFLPATYGLMFAWLALSGMTMAASLLGLSALTFMLCCAAACAVNLDLLKQDDMRRELPTWMHIAIVLPAVGVGAFASYLAARALVLPRLHGEEWSLWVAAQLLASVILGARCAAGLGQLKASPPSV